MAAPALLDNTGLDSRSYYDKLISTLRYAQKAALTQHRYVCTSFDAASQLTLTYTATIPTSSTCAGTSLISPNGQSAYTISPPAGVTLSITDAGNNPISLPSSFSFSPEGKPLVYIPPPTLVIYGIPVPSSGLVSMKLTFMISGYVYPVTIEGETGYVH